MPEEYAEFEFGLVWDKDRKAFDTNLRYSVADLSDWPLRSSDPLRIDLDELRHHENDVDAYGTSLTEMVFDGSGDVAEFFQKAIAAAQNDPVHFRIHIDGPAKFQSVRWELLRTPTGSSIATSSNILLSRYLAADDWSPLRARTEHATRALIVVASPNDLHLYHPHGRKLASLDVEAEVKHAQEALSLYQYEVLANTGQGPPAEPAQATLESIMQTIDDPDSDGFDILYLVCHGTLVGDVPELFLERPDGTTDRVDARRLAERISGLERKPALAVLISCQSAGNQQEPHSDDEGVLAALGPRLAVAGVGAVVAMQGNITKTSADRFTPAFFRRLALDAAVDQAMATARNAISDRPDWWVPVLFSRLRSGRAYSTMAPTEDMGKTWRELQVMVPSHRFTPIIGPGLADGILGSRQEIARRWARRWQMPIAPHGQGNLVQVAEYLRVSHSTNLVNAYMEDYLRAELRERKEKAKGSDPFCEIPRAVVEGEPGDAIVEVGRRLRQEDPGDPYRSLAALPVEVYVTTGWTDLLQAALRDNEPKKEPVTMCFPWTDRVEWTYPTSSKKINTPSESEPWVYHLFGRLDVRDSLVLTEEDYFAWLTAWIGKRKSIPPLVQGKMGGSSLMFLGFRLDDWDFRVVFQGIKSFLGHRKIRNSTHVGVQLRPENDTIEPDAAQKYLQSYFEDDRLKVFWATPREFLDQLGHRIGRP